MLTFHMNGSPHPKQAFYSESIAQSEFTQRGTTVYSKFYKGTLQGNIVAKRSKEKGSRKMRQQLPPLL